MDYLIAVKSPAYGSQGAYSAYQFAQALLQAGHRIRQIFFFQEGVSNGNGLVYPANDEFDMIVGNRLRVVLFITVVLYVSGFCIPYIQSF